jgi:hypothetical protein
VFILLPGDEANKKRMEQIQHVLNSEECQTISAPFNQPGAKRMVYTIYYMCPLPVTA